MTKIRTILTATIGNAIEYYDITLYGFFAVFLSPLFFPSEDLANSQFASLAAFAISFLARPFGGLIFGHIGDRWGRKRALVLAVLLVTIPTTIMGLLPTYATIGIFAPIILVLCRIMQGICTGGEYTGAAIFLSEHHRNQKREGFICSLLPASSLIGALLGTTLGGLCTLPFMPTWAWRVPFLLGAVFGLIGYFLRSSLVETPEFLANQTKEKQAMLPLLQVFSQDKRSFLSAFWLSAFHLVLFYTPVVYIVQFMLPKDTLVSSGMFLNTGFLVLLIALFPLMGIAADVYGRKRVMMTAALAIFALAIPLFLFLNYENSLLNVFVVLLAFCVVSGASVGPAVSFIPTLFPTQNRYSAMALATGLGDALGGATPLICHGFVSAFGTPIAPAFYVMICSVFGIIAIKYSRPIGSNLSTQEEDISALEKKTKRGVGY
ncbi:MAG: MFS transporter [Alphaproteobacteria bacterium]|nr:MFS transporter [Alphaproteobacteria bacterium]